MKNMKRIAAVLTSLTLAAAAAGCTPTIGAGTENAMNINGYDVRSGVFLYYTMQAYSDAVSELASDSGTSPDLKTVKSSRIDDLEAEDWIQDKATQYCEDYAAIRQEFERLGLELTSEDLDQIDLMAEYYFSADSRYSENGITEDTIRDIAASTLEEQAVFEHYYGLGGEKSCTEDELKDYFDENFARVKYFTISMTDDEGNALGDDEKRELRKKAEIYVKQINAKSGELDKMLELDAASDDYNEYLDSLTTSAEDEEGTDTETTVTTAADTVETTEITDTEDTEYTEDTEDNENNEDEETEETVTSTTVVSEESDTEEDTETTTTDPYANERLVQKQTTTAPSGDSSETTETETDSARQSREFNEHLFEMPLGKAEIYDYSDDEIYVVIRGDLRERMTEDDLWSEDYVSQLLQIRFYDEFTDYMKELAKNAEITKNNRAYNRYSPFKLTLETQQA
ncbi:MAG: hypothetical protein IJ666_08635 [Ruminococcus sp.]|nr:hypothetical protein [Ruminococcus sp.]